MNGNRNGDSGNGRARTATTHRQVMEHEDYDRLWRAQYALQALAAINHDIATQAGISHNATAAVAEYIRDDMLEVLNASKPDDEVS